MIRRPPRSTQSRSSAASDVYKRQPVAPGQVRPQQIANIPLFDGERGEGFVNWVETLENARDAYDWPIDSLVGVAKSRGGPKIAEWLRGKRLQGTTFQVWGTNAGLKKALMTRFGPKHTSATAILAVSELKQRSSEPCADFMDQVLLAVDRTHYNLTPAQKQVCLLYTSPSPRDS